MNLSMPTELAVAGLSQLDRARVFADFWGEHNLYCPSCSSPTLKRAKSQAGDFSCPDCECHYQVKGQATPFRDSIAAGDFDAVTRAMRNGKASGYFFLHYDARTWTIRDLLLVPLFAVPDSAITRRAARCHFLLEKIPAEARISVVTTIRSASPGGTECIMISRPEDVREKFRRLRARQGKRARAATRPRV
ncbi:MAG TPA: DpnI domain-containing protein [Candidatus Acidoferrales bacterium]|nr:DpnI domain-containing protein [Candidatus Acidoferrales bacterium]